MESLVERLNLSQEELLHKVKAMVPVNWLPFTHACASQHDQLLFEPMRMGGHKHSEGAEAKFMAATASHSLPGQITKAATAAVQRSMTTLAKQMRGVQDFLVQMQT